MKCKKKVAALLAGASLFSLLAGCAANAQNPGSAEPSATPSQQVQEQDAGQLTAPKYVFLFIGDGMSYPQIQSTADYLGALEDEDYWQAQPSLDDNGGAIFAGVR